MTTLDELSLRHVDPTKLLFQQRHPAFPVEEPEWFTNATAGGLSFTAWLRGTVLATMEMRVQKPAYYAVVSVMGLFISLEQETAQAEEFSSEVDDSILSEASDDELAAFVRKVADELYPFLRTEVYALTGKMQGVQGVMLQPKPLMHDRRMQVMSVREAVRFQAHDLGFKVSHNIATKTDTFEMQRGFVTVVYSADLQDIAEVHASNGQQYPVTPGGAFTALQEVAASHIEPPESR